MSHYYYYHYPYVTIIQYHFLSIIIELHSLQKVLTSLAVRRILNHLLSPIEKLLTGPVDLLKNHNQYSYPRKRAVRKKDLRATEKTSMSFLRTLETKNNSGKKYIY